MSRNEFDPLRTDFAPNPAKKHHEDELTPFGRVVKNILQEGAIAAPFVIAAIYAVGIIIDRNNASTNIPNRPAPYEQGLSGQTIINEIDITPTVVATEHPIVGD